MRRLFAILSAISLLLCVGASVLWWRSWNHVDLNEDRHSWLTERGDRCTIRSDAGELTWFTPPAGNPNAKAKIVSPTTWPTTGPSFPLRTVDPDTRYALANLSASGNSPTAREMAASIRNEQLEWYGAGGYDYTGAIYDGHSQRRLGCWAKFGSAAFLFNVHNAQDERLDLFFARPGLIPLAFSTPDAVSVLLPALEDPRRFAVSHFLLMHLVPQVTIAREDYVVVNLQTVMMDGLRVDPFRHENDPPDAGNPFTLFAGHYDPSQLPMIRDQWHRRLDVAAYSAPLWAITAATGLLPAIWITRFSRQKALRSRRTRAGQCLACGYDMRSSAGRCPECGAVATL